MTAAPIGCDICNQELGAMLVTNLSNGDTAGIGPGCLHEWAQQIADATKPPKPEPAQAPQGSAGAGDDGETPAAKPGRPRRRKAATESVSTGSDDLAAIVADADAAAD
jgi:hypothetical protein